MTSGHTPRNTGCKATLLHSDQYLTPTADTQLYKMGSKNSSNVQLLLHIHIMVHLRELLFVVPSADPVLLCLGCCSRVGSYENWLVSNPYFSLMRMLHGSLRTLEGPA